MDGAFTAFCSSRSIPDASTAMPATLDAVSAYFAGMTAAETAGSTRGTGESGFSSAGESGTGCRADGGRIASCLRTTKKKKARRRR